jgi:hypothetical protein
VIDVPDRADVHVRLAAIEFFLCHFEFAFCTDSLQGNAACGAANLGCKPGSPAGLDALESASAGRIACPTSILP